MTPEEKARRYDEAIEKMKSKLKNFNEIIISRSDIEDIFPELKESGDEKIRQFLIREVTETSDKIMSYRNMNKKDVLAWLEKQGEQKPTDKVEPKFHEGDWAVSNLDGKARQISEVHFDEYNSYYVVDGKSVNLEEYDRLHHLWTIQDAKDGDILIDKSNNRENPFIFKETKPSNIKTDVLNPLTVLGYCGIGGAGFTKGNGWGDTANCTYYPATKERRDILFQKMKEAGYEWDAETKELKKIESTNIPENFEKYVEHLLSLSDGEGYGSPAKVKEVSAELLKLAKLEQNSVWSEEDEKIINFLCELLTDLQVKSTENEIKHGTNSHSEYYYNIKKWLKDKVQSQPQIEWSEEDEENLIDAIKYLELFDAQGIHGNIAVPCINWLKSLKDRYTWKPSDEHYELEEFAKIVRGNLTGISKAVQELFEAKYLQLTGNKMYKGFKD